MIWADHEELPHRVLALGVMFIHNAMNKDFTIKNKHVKVIALNTRWTH